MSNLPNGSLRRVAAELEDRGEPTQCAKWGRAQLQILGEPPTDFPMGKASICGGFLLHLFQRHTDVGEMHHC